MATAGEQGRTGPVVANAVPEVTLRFWLIEIMATTVGETAADLLAPVDKGDVPAARARVKEPETARDRAEATPKPKPKDQATWTDLDGRIDAALTDLRTPDPKPAACAASLEALIARMDAIDKA